VGLGRDKVKGAEIEKAEWILGDPLGAGALFH